MRTEILIRRWFLDYRYNIYDWMQLRSTHDKMPIRKNTSEWDIMFHVYVRGMQREIIEHEGPSYKIRGYFAEGGGHQVQYGVIKGREGGIIYSAKEKCSTAQCSAINPHSRSLIQTSWAQKMDFSVVC